MGSEKPLRLSSIFPGCLILMENLAQDGKYWFSKEPHCQSQEGDGVGWAKQASSRSERKSGLGLQLSQTQHLGSGELITGKD